jgi:hypothetical protein
MSRVTWCRLLILLMALPLASCFGANEPCPTCPPEDSARIDVKVPKVGEVDSVHVKVDGGAPFTVRRDKRGSVQGLRAGVHTVEIVRYFSSFGIVSTRSSVIEVSLGRGETRVIVFHNDFPLVADASRPGRASPDSRPDRPPPAPAFRTFHPGWALA